MDKPDPTASDLVAELGEKANLAHPVHYVADVAANEACAEARKAYTALAVNSLPLLVGALEQGMSPGGHVGSCIAVGGNQGCVPNCLDAKEALAAVRDEARKAMP